MSFSIEDLTGHPNKLAAYYQDFAVAERLLLTGHSHQAWPDVAFSGIRQCYEEAAFLVDEKWERAFEKADDVREGFRRLLDDKNGHITLSGNTHELLIRFLSALPLKSKPKLITTDGEFHTIRRQLSRLGEEGIEICRVPSLPVNDIAGQVISKLDDRVSAVLISSVFFESGLINPGLKQIADNCLARGIELLVDVYHSLNVVPFSIRQNALENAFIIGGGYKYCQLGEGNCFMRFPENYRGRPVITGWFSEFGLLAKKKAGIVEYGEGPDLFAGSTYDPVSHYRAAEVFDFFNYYELTDTFLRKINQHQVSVLLEEFSNLDLPKDLIHTHEDVNPDLRGGFLVLYSEQAEAIHKNLLNAGVLTDYRGNSLRLGPAPYLSDDQLRQAIGILGEVTRTLID